MQNTPEFRKAQAAYWHNPPESRITGQHISPSDRLEAAIRAWEDAKEAEDAPIHMTHEERQKVQHHVNVMFSQLIEQIPLNKAVEESSDNSESPRVYGDGWWE